MYVGRDLAALTMTRMDDWETTELMYYHHVFSQLAAYLSAEGTSLHNKIIRELESRGPIGTDSGGWDHSSSPLYD